MYKFSRKSLERLGTCHQDLQRIAKEAIKSSSIDFGIAEGHRSVADQLKYYNEGKSKIDGVTKKGKHNHTPSLAFDIYAYGEGKANWAVHNLAYIGGVIDAVTARLLADGKISHTIRWGGNWDGDGVILTDQTFDDLPHFELKTV